MQPTTKILYGQVETYQASKDYQRGGRCLRVYAVEKQYFDQRRIEAPEGVPVLALDVDFWTYCRTVLGTNSWVTRRARAPIEAREFSGLDKDRWYQFVLSSAAGPREAYTYATFAGELPSYFSLVETSEAPGAPILPSFPLALSAVAAISGVKPWGGPNPTSSPKWTITAFHVGQGMCSLISDGERGFLMDCGAGTPIKRPSYLHGSITNHLASAIAPLKEVRVVLSHADSDHWRILAWDTTLRSKVSAIYLPKGAKSLAFRDPAVVSKTVEVADITFPLAPRVRLRIMRSQPYQVDDNSDCLVAVFERGSERVLIAGDYVYQRFAADGHTGIKDLHSLEFDAVIVPHHGDAASAFDIVPAKPRAKAFFSAGNHKAYKHPRVESLDAHAKANFSIVNPTGSGILAHPLL